MKSVVIIGAGPSGLTAAYEILKKGKYRVVLIEKEKTVGGISKTLRYKGNRMDLGGHRFFTKNQEINKLWLELLKEQGTAISDTLEPCQKEIYSGTGDPNLEDEVMLVRRRVSRIYYLDTFFDYPISITYKTIKNLGFLRTLKCGVGYIQALVFKREEDSLEDFYINRFGKPLYEIFFKDYTTKLWGVSPKQLSPEWGGQRVKKLSLVKTFKDAILKKFSSQYTTQDSSLIQEFYYPKYGPGQLWEKMASVVREMGAEIHMETECSKIITENGAIKGIEIQRAMPDTKFLTCDYLVSSMPIRDLISRMSKNVPKDIEDISNKLPYRDFITVGVLTKKIQLKNKTVYKTYRELVPDCWIYIQEKNIKMGRMQIFNNWSPYMVEKPRETVWIGLEYFCTQGDEMWEMKSSDFIEFALQELEQMEILKKADVLDTTLHKVEKAYPAYYGSYQYFDRVREFLNGFENLICVGRNGQHRYNNMDHSMMTGIVAADVIEGKVSKEYAWNINTDCEYHEERGP